MPKGHASTHRPQPLQKPSSTLILAIIAFFPSYLGAAPFAAADAVAKLSIPVVYSQGARTYNPIP